MTDQEPGARARRCALTVPSSLAFLPMVQGFVREYAREAGYATEELGRLDLVMEEAATNVIEGALSRRADARGEAPRAKRAGEVVLPGP